MVRYIAILGLLAVIAIDEIPDSVPPPVGFTFHPAVPSWVEGPVKCSQWDGERSIDVPCWKVKVHEWQEERKNNCGRQSVERDQCVQRLNEFL